jgi:hypothetical protein
MKRPALCLAALLPLAACFPVGGPFAGIGTCPARQLQPLVGRPERAAYGITYPGPTRVLHPGEITTMDHNPERLNVKIGPNGRIKRIYCG